eukprot:1266181-Prymnesium_polylepis.1
MCIRDRSAAARPSTTRKSRRAGRRRAAPPAKWGTVGVRLIREGWSRAAVGKGHGRGCAEFRVRAWATYAGSSWLGL